MDSQSTAQKKIYEVIFGYESKAGRWFDILLILLIIISVSAVLLDSIASVHTRRKIFVFLFSVVTLIILFGALMFIIEGGENGFDSIPQSIYWAIVTITTVGYDDIAPQTPLGQFVAAIAMICGYAIIAVPTGIIGAELMQQVQDRGKTTTTQSSEGTSCKATGHDLDALHCKYCGNRIQQR